MINPPHDPSQNESGHKVNKKGKEIWLSQKKITDKEKNRNKKTTSFCLFVQMLKMKEK